MEMTNILNNPKFNMQTICVIMKDPVVDVTEENWPILQEREFYIVDDEHSVLAIKAPPVNDKKKNPLKETIRFWKAFVVHSRDSNQF